MQASQSFAEMQRQASSLVLGVDTCGPMGSVALTRLDGATAAVLAQIELEGRSYSETLMFAVRDLLAGQRLKLRDVGTIVVVNGPGSFTGVRVGVGAVKGLAEPGQIPVVAVSRLAVLAANAGVDAAALDARRHETFLRIDGANGRMRELLAGAEELADVDAQPGKVGVCDDQAAELLKSCWPDSELIWRAAPTAADAIHHCGSRIRAGEFDDLASIDGHYLRRTDAEIFGLPASAKMRRP